MTRAGRGGLDVVLVHRPRYDDWSFPKGKAKRGESDEECALREVEEETGLRCRLCEELPSATYLDGRGRPKLVRYWQMKRLAGVLRPTSEVDAAEWLAVADARKRLSSERDRDLLEALVAQRAR